MNLEPINFGNGIFLFKNVLKDPKKAYEFIKNSQTNLDDKYFNKNTWEDWLIWGKKSTTYPASNLEYENDTSYGAELQKECIKVFFEMIKAYKNNYIDLNFFKSNFYDTDLPESYEDLKERLSKNNWSHYIADFVAFESNKNNYEEWHMLPHQDQVFWWGGSRNIFNCNIYLNDDFTGGEMAIYNHKGKKETYIDSYSKEKHEAMIMEDHTVYKMQAGDAILLQTNAWHGVFSMKNNTSKYYIRQLLCASDHPDKQKNIELFGSNYEDFYKKEKKHFEKSRITPVPFDDLLSIDLDSPNYGESSDTKIACVVLNNDKLIKNGEKNES